MTTPPSRLPAQERIESPPDVRGWSVKVEVTHRLQCSRLDHDHVVWEADRLERAHVDAVTTEDEDVSVARRTEQPRDAAVHDDDGWLLGMREALHELRRRHFGSGADRRHPDEDDEQDYDADELKHAATPLLCLTPCR